MSLLKSLLSRQPLNFQGPLRFISFSDQVGIYTFKDPTDFGLR